MTVKQDLDTAASRAEILDRDSATSRQTNFLASLIEQCGNTSDDVGCGLTNTQAMLTKKAASDFIGIYLDKVKTVSRAPVTTNVTVNLKSVVDMLTAAKAHLKWPKIRFEDANVRLSVAGDRAKFPGSINVTSNAGYGESIFYGRIQTDGTFQAARAVTTEVETFLTGLAADPQGVVRQHGHDTGNCCFCYKTLTDPRSVEVGYGPVCAGHFGLPH